MNNSTYPGARPVLQAIATLAASAHFTCAIAQDSDEQEIHHEIDEIIVRATVLERTVEQLAQPTSVLTGDELIRKQSTSIGETVSQELGVSSSYFGPVSSRPVIRGQYGQRVQMLTNSLDSLDVSALSEDHAVSVSSILAESVEIVRGPGHASLWKRCRRWAGQRRGQSNFRKWNKWSVCRRRFPWHGRRNGQGRRGGQDRHWLRCLRFSPGLLPAQHR